MNNSGGVVCCQLFGIVPLGPHPTTSSINPSNPPSEAEISRSEDSHLHTLLHTLSLLQRSDTDDGFTIIRTPVPYNGLFKVSPIPPSIDDQGMELFLLKLI